MKRCRPVWSIRMIRRLPEVERQPAVLRDFVATIGLEGHRRSRRWEPLRNSEVHDQRCFRAVARLRRTRRASSLLPLKRGTRDGSSLLDPRIERIIEEQIERFWLKKEKPRFSALMERSWNAFTTLATSRVCGRHIEKQSNAASWSLTRWRRPAEGGRGFGGGVYPKPRPVCRRPS